MDKNPGGAGGAEIARAMRRHDVISVQYDDPLTKASFLDWMVRRWDAPVLYLDFDLMYSGFLASGMLKGGECLEMRRPSRDSLYEEFKAVLGAVAGGRSVAVLDSLGGFYNMLGGKNSGQVVHACVMLLAFAAEGTGSQIVLANAARPDGESIELPPTEKRISENRPVAVVRLEERDSMIAVRPPGAGAATDLRVAD